MQKSGNRSTLEEFIGNKNLLNLLSAAAAMYWRVVLFVVLYASSATSQTSDDDDDGDEDSEYEEPGAVTKNCICVPFYQCVDGEIVTDGTNIIGPMTRPGNKKEVPIDKKHATPQCGTNLVCCRKPGAAIANPHKCGFRILSGINGEILSDGETGKAKFGEWPWQAAIFRRTGNQLDLLCGGALIDEQHVLTTAHCTKISPTDESLVIRLGEWDRQHTNDEKLPHEDFDVFQIILHPKYHEKTFDNDLAIIKLAEKVQFKPHINAVCLPREEDNFVGQECTVAGWGTNLNDENGPSSGIMKEVSLSVISNSQCQAMLRKAGFGKYTNLLHKGVMCAAGNSGQDTCHGDGGSPLVCNRSDNSYAVAGLVLWGIGECGTGELPGSYVNVQKYSDWIAAVIAKPATN